MIPALDQQTGFWYFSLWLELFQTQAAAVIKLGAAFVFAVIAALEVIFYTEDGALLAVRERAKAKWLGSRVRSNA